jgi:hypothetical protein
MNEHFYSNWQFWYFVIAATAVLLSQLPPIHILVKKARIDCETFSKLLITHRIGNSNAQWHLIIENTGGRIIRIKEIYLVFKRLNDPSFKLPAQNYLKTPDESEPVIFTPFRLKPGEEWAHVINFFMPIERDDEKEFRFIESSIRIDILNKKGIDGLNKQMIETDDAYVSRAKIFFEKHFKWKRGEWEIELN